MSRTDLRPTRRSFVSVLLASFLPSRLRFAGSRMTIADDLEWLFRWCGLTPAAGMPAAA